MTHARKQLRDHFIDALTGLTTTQQRVFQSRIYPMGKTDMPGLCVYSKDEVSEPMAMGNPRPIYRKLIIAVEIYVKCVEGYDDKIDKIAAEIEEAINDDSLPIYNLVKNIYLAGTIPTLSGDSEKPVAVSTMNFMVEYVTAENDPNTIL